MVFAGASLFIFAFIVSVVGTFLARRYARKLGLMDDPGHRKVHTIATPRNGGIGIFWGFAVPVLAGVAGVWLFSPESFPLPVAEFLRTHVSGMREHAPLALILLGAALLVHIVGLLDDRKAMAPWPKLLAQLGIATGLVIGGEFIATGAFRVFTFHAPPWSPMFFLSCLVSICWIVALTNAFNFLDNMDGLSAGVAFICAGMFLIAAGFNQQYFVVALLLVFMGSVMGFLCFNFPPASIFMGDGGSMVLGFILSVLTIRTTYYGNGQWYSVLMPLFVMAVPLYDLIIVSILRMLKGRSPMTGDTNHFSHRLTRHGFSKRGAVLVIYGVTLATGFTAPLLARVDDAGALLLAGQLLSILIVIGVLERVGEHTQ